jgi:hypothetical protein
MQKAKRVAAIPVTTTPPAQLELAAPPEPPPAREMALEAFPINIRVSEIEPPSSVSRRAPIALGFEMSHASRV